jgi:hypothetical protein
VRTEPDLVIRAGDPDPLAVIVEVKRGDEPHTVEQVAREAIDVAAGGLGRVAAVMVGAPLAPPMSLPAWRGEVAAAVAGALGRSVEVELAYSSFRDLGRAVSACAAAEPTWRRYADDVLGHLHREGVVGYDGAPMLDDLGSLTLRSAGEAFNRAVRQARLLAQAVVADDGYRALGLPSQVDLLRGGNTGRISMTGASWFEQRSFLIVLRPPRAPEGAGAYVLFGVDLTPPDERPAELVAGAARLSCTPPEAWYHLHRRAVALSPESPLLARQAPELPEASVTPRVAEWRLDHRPWTPGDGDEDLRWCVSRLGAACRLWGSLA